MKHIVCLRVPDNYISTKTCYSYSPARDYPTDKENNIGNQSLIQRGISVYMLCIP